MKASNTAAQSNKEVKQENLEIKEGEKLINSSTIEINKNKNANDLAIYIVKALKYLFEECFCENDNEKDMKEQFEINNNLGKAKNYRNYSLTLFDESFNYYTDLRDYLANSLKIIISPNKLSKNNIKNLMKSKFSIYYLSLLLDLLLDILQKEPLAHQDNIIKFDISVICELFHEKNERLCSSHSFFYSCVNELKVKYKVKLPENNEFRKKFFEKCKKKASETLKKVKKDFFEDIKYNLNEYYKLIYSEMNNKIYKAEKEQDVEECEPIKKDCDKLFQLILAANPNINSYQEIQEWCDNNGISDYLKNYAEYLAEKKCLKYAEKENYKKNIIDKHLLPFEIFRIDENNEENIYIISSIDYDEKFDFSKRLLNDESFLDKYLLAKEEINYLRLGSYEEDMKNLINDDKFLDEFFSILKSKHVSAYLKSGIKFANDLADNYNLSLIEPKTENSDDEDSIFDLELQSDIYLGKQFKQFKKDFEGNYNKFRNLIIIKELGYKIPSCTGPSIRIFMNPRLIFSKEAIENNSQRISILKSAIIILWIHEITHVLKYYPVKDVYPKITPSTPKNKENGKCILFYLFKKDVINKINYAQSSEIINLDNWKNLETLQNIFNNNNNSNSSEKLYEKEGELDLCVSDLGVQEQKKNKKRLYLNDYCWW